jgi:hypothetical protein
VTPAEARAAARQILARPEFRPRRPPRPLHGVLRWIGERFRPIGDAVDSVTASKALAAAVVVVVLVLVSVVTTVVINRRAGAAIAAGTDRGDRRRPERPAELERRAEDAERTGDLELALRLRFRAGLLRLDEAGALRYRPSLTTGAVLRSVPSDRLRALAGSIEEVVYGGRPAAAEDVAAAREGWPAVLAEVRS